MTRPNITPGPYALEAGRNIVTKSGTFYLSYGEDRATGRKYFSSPTELDRIAQAVAFLPDILEAFEKLLTASSAQLPQGADHEGIENCKILAKCRAALTESGYTF